MHRTHAVRVEQVAPRAAALGAAIDRGGLALVVGALADTIGFSPLFAVLAVFDLLGALVIWTVLKNKPADDDSTPLSSRKPVTQS